MKMNKHLYFNDFCDHSNILEIKSSIKYLVMNQEGQCEFVLERDKDTVRKADK